MELRQVVQRDLGSLLTVFEKAQLIGLKPENGDIYFELGKTVKGPHKTPMVMILFRKVKMGPQPIVDRVSHTEKLPLFIVQPELEVPPIQLINPIMNYT